MRGWLVHNGVGLHWREDGNPSGQPVLFLNSLGTDLRLWDDMVSRLPDMRSIRMDTRGHGLSDAPEGEYSLEDLADDVGALIDNLDLSDIVVIGVSLGGMMAQAVAASRPHVVAHLILSNTGLRMGTPEMWEDRIKVVRTEGVQSIADAVLDRWFGATFLDHSDLPLWRNMLTQTSPIGYAGCCAALAEADVTPLASKLTCRTTVIGGGQDSASPPDTVRAVATVIPNATYHEVASAGHLPMIEAPDAFAAIVASAIKEHAYV